MSLQVDLRKSQAALSMCLTKAGITTLPVVEVAACMDVSGSFEDEHRDGVTTKLLTRLVPWGLTLDPDKKLDVFTFSDGKSHVHHCEPITELNYHNYISDHVYKKVPGFNGGTHYSYVIEATLKEFGWGQQEKPSLMQRLLGKPAAEKVAKRKSMAFLVTDGENNDKARTEQVLATSEERGDCVYFVFLGVSNQQAHFDFIKELGRKFSNVGFVAVPDLRPFVSMTDEDLNKLFLTEEFTNWLKA